MSNTTNNYLAECYLSAADLLPYTLRSVAMSAPEPLWRKAEEFRLRAGRNLAVTTPSGELELPVIVTTQDLAELVNAAARGSLHSVADALGAGYITATGGHRVGICGSAVTHCGATVGVRSYSSANLRIAKQILGVAEEIFEQICGAEGAASTLIFSPPGVGKTTLLRDLIRLISDAGERVSVADERCEIAALADGVAGFDLGKCTDVLENATKSDAILALLRSMSPRVIALDELTDPSDFAALEKIEGCGVKILATMHAKDAAQLRARHGETLLRHFEKMVNITYSMDGQRTYNVKDISTC